MKIKYSALVSGTSGKLNGSVAATNRGGAYLRNKGVVTNPQSVSQQLNRSRFGALSSQFRGLTSSQIAAWNTAAATFPYTDQFGDVRYLSGLSLFIQLNTNLIIAGQAQISDPPVKQTFPSWDPANSTCLINVGSDPAPTLSFEYQFDVANMAGFTGVFRATPPLDPSVSYVKNLFRQLTTEVNPAGGNLTVDQYSKYTDVFGAPPVGSKVVVEMRVVSNVSGESSIAYTQECIVISEL